MIKVKFKGNRIMVKCTSIADLQSGKREEGALDNEQHQLPIHHKLNMEKSSKPTRSWTTNYTESANKFPRER